MVDTILHRCAHNHCLLMRPRCVQGFAGLMVLKTNPSDPPPEEIKLRSLGCRCTCVGQGVDERRREHGASFKDQHFQLQNLLFCNLGYFLAVHMEKKRGIVWWVASLLISPGCILIHFNDSASCQTFHFLKGFVKEINCKGNMNLKTLRPFPKPSSLPSRLILHQKEEKMFILWNTLHDF